MTLSLYLLRYLTVHYALMPLTTMSCCMSGWWWPGPKTSGWRRARCMWSPTRAAQWAARENMRSVNSKYQWWGADLRRGESDPDPSAHFDLDPVLGIPILIFVLVYVNNSIISKLHFLGYYVELPCSFNQPSDVNKKKFKSSSYGVRQQAFFITY